VLIVAWCGVVCLLTVISGVCVACLLFSGGVSGTQEEVDGNHEHTYDERAEVRAESRGECRGESRSESRS
jgi:hypothetical protein